MTPQDRRPRIGTTKANRIRFQDCGWRCASAEEVWLQLVCRSMRDRVQMYVSVHFPLPRRLATRLVGAVPSFLAVRAVVPLREHLGKAVSVIVFVYLI